MEGSDPGIRSFIHDMFSFFRFATRGRDTRDDAVFRSANEVGDISIHHGMCKKGTDESTPTDRYIDTYRVWTTFEEVKADCCTIIRWK